MATPHNAREQSQSEGITDHSALVDFTEEAMAMIIQNLRRPGGRIQDPDQNATPGATMPTPPFILGANSQMRLIVACDLMRCYETVGRSLSCKHKVEPCDKELQVPMEGLKESQEE